MPARDDMHSFGQELGKYYLLTILVLEYVEYW